MPKNKFRYVEAIWTTAYANKSVVKILNLYISKYITYHNYFLQNNSTSIIWHTIITFQKLTKLDFD